MMMAEHARPTYAQGSFTVWHCWIEPPAKPSNAKARNRYEAVAGLRSHARRSNLLDGILARASLRLSMDAQRYF